MAQASTLCNHSGCYCKGYIVPISKWSKGKCKNCNHTQKEHGAIVVDITFDDDAVAPAPQGITKYDANIDRGATNFENAGNSKPQNTGPSIYSIHLDETNWINWSPDELLVWFQQKKRFPDELKIKDIEHEMKKQNVNGSKMTQLTHSTLLSYGFTDYNHRTRVITEVKSLLNTHPPAAQNSNYNAPQNNAQQKPKEEEKKKEAAPKVSKEEGTLLKEANLNEKEWKTWSADQVWQWIKIKEGWVDSEDMEYLFVHKLNEYEEKLKSEDVDLTGAKLMEVQQDIKTQKLLKGIGFPFSLRKKVYKHIDVLVRHNSD